MRLTSFLAAVWVLSSAGHAQQIGYRINGGSTQTVTVSQTPPYSDIVIDLGTVTTNTDVHIFDTAGIDDSVGIITIRGRLTATVPVRVVIGDAALPDVGNAFNDPVTSVLPGLRHVGGVAFMPPSQFPDDMSLRDNAALSLNILGDLTGNVTAGNLYRVDVRRSIDINPANRFGGTISGTLRATRGDGVVLGFDGSLLQAIGYVRAGHAITGNVIADGERDANGQPVFDVATRATWGSVGRLVVGPYDQTDPPPGMRGDVLCEYGEIRDIYCAGQVGDGPEQGDRVSIVAGVRLSRLAVRDESDPIVLDEDVYADVQASARGVPSPAESSLTLIETEGDFVGNVELHDFFGLNDQAPGRADSGRKGIFVGGDFHGDISVTYSYQYGDMIARSFRGEIVIGQMLKGAIVAVGTEGSEDPLDGTLKTVIVGFRSDLSDPPRPNLPGFNSVQTAVIHPPFTKYCIDVLGVDARGVA